MGLLVSTFWFHDVTLPALKIQTASWPSLTLVAWRAALASILPSAIGLWMLHARQVRGFQDLRRPLLITLGIAVIDTSVFVAISLYFAYGLSKTGWAT